MSHSQVVHPKELLQKGEGDIAKFNNQVVKVLASALGNIYFFYACVVLDLIMLPPVVSAKSTITWVTYIAQTVIQLVALPILQLYQNVQQAADQAKADVDHRALSYLATLQDEQLAILKKLEGGK